MKVSLDVNNCRECPHSRNNAMDHDDAFTSGPSDIYWYCTFKKDLIIEDAWIIDPNCPIKSKQNV